MSDLRIHHNLVPRKFKWLWMKYVTCVNDAHHCTNCLRGKYSKVLSAHNAELGTTPLITLNEHPSDSFSAVYICGVSKQGYPGKNYPHNLHVAIRPQAGAHDLIEFEHWKLQIENGVLLPIPGENELPERYRKFAPEYTTCRIFRWAVCSEVNPSKVTDD